MLGRRQRDCITGNEALACSLNTAGSYQRNYWQARLRCFFEIKFHTGRSLHYRTECLDSHRQKTTFPSAITVVYSRLHVSLPNVERMLRHNWSTDVVFSVAISSEDRSFTRRSWPVGTMLVGSETTLRCELT